MGPTQPATGLIPVLHQTERNCSGQGMTSLSVEVKHENRQDISCFSNFIHLSGQILNSFWFTAFCFGGTLDRNNSRRIYMQIGRTMEFTRGVLGQLTAPKHISLTTSCHKPHSVTKHSIRFHILRRMTIRSVWFNEKQLIKRLC